MNTDKVHIHITGDRTQGESLVRFAIKKLMELPLVRGENTSRKIIFPNGTSVVVQHTENRQNIFIHVPVSILLEKKEELEGGRLEGLLLLYGIPWEVLVLESQGGTFLSGEGVFCGDGNGEIFKVAGRNLVGSYIRCWDSGDYVAGNLSKAAGVISECRRMVYEFTYKSNFVFSQFELSPGFIAASPADIFYRMCRDNLNQEWRTHTITIGNKLTGWMTVTAVEHQPYASLGLSFLTEWFLCGIYNGRQVTFDGSNTSLSTLRENNRVLFDLWQEDESFCVSAVRGNSLLVWKYDKKKGDFVSSESYSFQNPIQGLDKRIVYGYYYDPINALLSVISREMRSGHEKEQNFHTDNTGAEYIDNLWNPYNKTFYIAWKKYYEHPPPPPPIFDKQCLYYTLLVTGVWYSCEFTCAYVPYLFNDYPCSPGNCSFCDEMAGSFVMVEQTGTIGYDGVGYNWAVDIAYDWDISGNVNTFYGTHYEFGIIPHPVKQVNPDFIVSGYRHGGGFVRGAELSGGSLTTGEYAFKVHASINGGGTDYYDIPLENWGSYCRGELRNYVLKNFIFTADDKGYYIDFAVTVTGCSGEPYSYESHVGEKKYLPAASQAPHDHNWTLIIPEDVEDTDGESISSLLFYAENAGTRIFYHGEEPFTYLPGNGNRAFLQYATTGE